MPIRKPLITFILNLKVGINWSHRQTPPLCMGGVYSNIKISPLNMLPLPYVGAAHIFTVHSFLLYFGISCTGIWVYSKIWNYCFIFRQKFNISNALRETRFCLCVSIKTTYRCWFIATLYYKVFKIWSIDVWKKYIKRTFDTFAFLFRTVKRLRRLGGRERWIQLILKLTWSINSPIIPVHLLVLSFTPPVPDWIAMV